MPFPPDSPLGQLMSRLPRAGRVRWIGVRPARDVAMRELSEVQVEKRGLVGDRYRSASGKRSVTLIQSEHLPVIAALCGIDTLRPARLRRNLVVEGLPLLALVGRRFRLGSAVLEGTGPCDPCSRMEAELGEGGYNALRGHGGITARVLQDGRVALGDALHPLDIAAPGPIQATTPE
jgi:MOSC domain-containing protein YiiM